MNRAAVIHLGCKVNRTESDGYERLLAALGFEPAAVADADMVVINTCTVTAAADKKARKAASGALRTNAFAPVIVTGCGAAVNPEQFTQLSPRVTVVAGVDMAAYLRQWAASADPTGARAVSIPAQMTRPSVKVQDGCDNRCSYCIVPTARGAARSLSRTEVFAGMQPWIDQGVGEIVLAGINLGAYDADGPLSGLLTDLLKILPDQTRLRLSSIEPDFVTDDLIEVLASSNGRICRHLHLPLQSGSEAVLSAMGRHYTAQYYRALVDRMRQAIPELSLSTDIIVGFPGESDDDFEATLELARHCGFSRIHTFTFSPRPGTPAADFPNPVAPKQARKRSQALHRLGDELATDDLKRRFGTREQVLIEAAGRWRTESYHLLEGNPTAVPGAVGTLAEVVIDPSTLCLCYN